jgi:hypothetical protein
MFQSKPLNSPFHPNLSELDALLAESIQLPHLQSLTTSAQVRAHGRPHRSGVALILLLDHTIQSLRGNQHATNANFVQAWRPWSAGSESA